MPLNLFGLENGIIIAQNYDPAKTSAGFLWCDLFDPTEEEENWVESQLKIEIPTRREMHKMELSSRFYLENGATYTTASVVTKMDTPEPEIHAVSFILKDKSLVTLRYSELHSFPIYARYLLADAEQKPEGIIVLVGLLETIISKLADALENSSHALGRLNSQLFRPSVKDKTERQESMPDFEELLRNIGVQGDLLSKTRESLLNITRVLSFISNTPHCQPQTEAYSRSHILGTVNKPQV